jgi:hypothetical protein
MFTPACRQRPPTRVRKAVRRLNEPCIQAIATPMGTKTKGSKRKGALSSRTQTLCTKPAAPYLKVEGILFRQGFGQPHVADYFVVLFERANREQGPKFVAILLDEVHLLLELAFLCRRFE